MSSKRLVRMGKPSSFSMSDRLSLGSIMIIGAVRIESSWVSLSETGLSMSGSVMILSWDRFCIFSIGFSYILGIKKPDQVSDQAGGFSFEHKKAPHFHVRLFVLLIIVMPNPLDCPFLSAS